MVWDGTPAIFTLKPGPGAAHADTHSCVGGQQDQAGWHCCVELEADAPAPNALSEAEVYAMIDSLGEVGHTLNRADPTRLQELYEALRLEMIYDADTRTVDVTIQPARRGSARVRGATRPLRTRPQSTQTPGSEVVRDFAPADACRFGWASAMIRPAWRRHPRARRGNCSLSGPAVLELDRLVQRACAGVRVMRSSDGLLLLLALLH
jgi:hypothetical protein